MSTEVAVQTQAVQMGFQSAAGFELIQRVAKGFAASKLVPETYRGNLPDCMIALEMAARMGASPLLVMQNLYLVHGNPGWSSKFLIACFNQCGRYTSLRYEFDGPPGAPTGCRAWAVEKSTNERLVGATVTVQMAKDEGWSTKSGSKWKTMPEQMLMYRAAAFMIRTYAPEISMGLTTSDELIDMGPVVEEYPTTTTLQQIKERARGTVEADPETGEIQGREPEGDPPVDGTAPHFTFAQVEEKLQKSANLDELNDAATLISSVTHPKQQKELLGVFERCRDALEAN